MQDVDLISGGHAVGKRCRSNRVRLGRPNSTDETTNVAHSENISLVACPFLGLGEDPGTPLGYAHPANQCYRLEKPVGIDLTHQNNFCLGENYTRCYVYAQSRRQSTKPAKKTAKQTSPLPDESQPELTKFPPPKRGLRILALLAMLFLIGIATIVWWPPPGTSLEDVVVRGSSIFKEVMESETDFSDNNSRGETTQDVLEESAPSVETSTGLVDRPAEDDSSAQTVSSASATSGEVIDEQAQEGTSAKSLTSLEYEGITSTTENIIAEDDRVVDKAEFDNPVEDFAIVISETDKPGEEIIEKEKENDQDAVQESSPQPIALEQLEQVERDSFEGQDASEISSSEAIISDTAPVEEETLSAPAVVKTTYIGPLSDSPGLQETSEPPPILYLLRHPGDGAEVLAMVPERQPVTVLGRTSSGEWLLVRLASGVEGWVHALESGASIVVSNLPITENVSGKVPISPNEDEPANSVEENQDSSPEISESSSFGTAVIKTGALNLRSGPGLDYESVGVGFNGQQVSLLEQFGSHVWIQIRLPNGTQGWVNSTYLAQTG
jgi:SH3-like domain-containing protein